MCGRALAEAGVLRCKTPEVLVANVSIKTKGELERVFLIKMNYEKQKQSGGKDEQFRLFVLFVLRKAL